MSRFRLILRNLSYFRGVNAALVAGMIVATAVLTGAMMVGDSVRDSLAGLARDRLGRTTDAVFARRFFDQSLVDRLAADPRVAVRYDVAPAITLEGGASNEQQTIRAGAVRVLAAGGNWAPVSAGRAILNGPTAGALGLMKPGGTVLLSLPDQPDQPRDAALSRRSREDTLSVLRVTVGEIHRARDMLSLFNPHGGQRVPQNAWVNLPELQDQVDLRGRVNAMLAHDRSGAGDAPGSADLLNERLHAVVRLEDYGIDLQPAGSTGQAALTSRTTYLDPPLVSAAESVARAANIPLQKVTVNLVSRVRLEPGGKEIHYAVAAGITPLDGHALADDEVAVNQWTADQLGAKVGDRISLAFYKRLSAGDLSTVSSAAVGFPNGLRVGRVLPMSGTGADPSLTPAYKGLTDKDSVADWNPPEGIEIDKKLVTKADEDYWHAHRAAPKLFVSFATAQKLWGGSIGEVTGLRLPRDRADELRRGLHDALDPAAMGVSFQPILARQLAASGGGSDFGGLFIGFSLFLIVAAVLLVAMLFRLSVEQRARQIGLMSAVGFGPWRLRRLALGEGMALALAGALLGLPAAIGYTWLMMYGLRTWWVGAVGTNDLHLSVSPATLAYGWAASLLAAFFAILWAVWQVGRTPAATLLAGGWGATARSRRAGRFLRAGGVALAIVALLIFGYAAYQPSDPAETFLGGGAILLCACLAWLGGAMRPGLRRPLGAVGVASITRLGVRNASRHTSRGVLAVGLIAFASFSLITVAAFRQGAPTDTGQIKSGAGGYRLMLDAGIPLLGDPNTRQGRRVLGMTDADAPLWNDVRFAPMRRWAGQDISCLNLTRPTSPTILSTPPGLSFVEGEPDQFRFVFAQSPPGAGNPWALLDKPLDNDDVPVIADDATAQYILNLPVDKTINVTDAAGATRHLRLVATLANSVFQSELLMGEANFRRLFPNQDGFGVALIDCPANRADAVRQALNTQLGDYAADVRPTADRLAQYFSIQNTYLSTFQALGALGLMLGTIGLAVVLVRTVVERRAELALLASLGFRRSDRLRLVLAENVFLLALGLVAGTVCAILAILPALRHSARGVNLPALGATLLIVLCVGLLASTLAVWTSGAKISPADLRRE